MQSVDASVSCELCGHSLAGSVRFCVECGAPRPSGHPASRVSAVDLSSTLVGGEDDNWEWSLDEFEVTPPHTPRPPSPSPAPRPMESTSAPARAPSAPPPRLRSSPAVDEGRSRSYLLAVEGDDAGKLYPLKRGRMSLGRSPGADIRLNGRAIAHQHARLDVSADGCTLIDLGSSTGTCVNSKPITSAARLRGGDSIALGPHTFVYLDGESAASPTQPSAAGSDTGTGSLRKRPRGFWAWLGTPFRALSRWLGARGEPKLALLGAPGEHPVTLDELPPPLSPDGGPVDSFRLPVVPSFRYLHGHAESDDRRPAIRATSSVAELVARVTHSTGGAFLVTGFRGVGKTTVVRDAMRALRAADPHILSVWINAARPTSTRELLYETVRRLFEELEANGALNELHPEVSRRLVLAYVRTSMAIKSSRSETNTTERNANLELNAQLLSKLGVGVSSKRTHTRQAATEASFLEYSATDVEHDFLRILELLRAPDPPPRRFQRRRRAAPWRAVVVLDELDKLTATEEGQKAFDALLSELKNILSTSSVHFILIGGVDLYFRYLQDSQRGNSLYESVFAWHLYVPCVWGASHELLAWLCPDPTAKGADWTLRLAAHLRYQGRGVFRRIVSEVNDLVSFDRSHRPSIGASGATARRIRLFARLEGVLAEFMEQAQRDGVLESRANRDRWMLGTYYATDWMLSRGERSFTVDDLYQRQKSDAMDTHLVLTEPQVAELVQFFQQSAVLVALSKEGAQRTLRGDQEQPEVVCYVLAPWVRDELALVRQTCAAGAEARLLVPPPANANVRAADLVPGLVIADRYTLLGVVGQGGMGGVFRGRDQRTQQTVAIKYLHDHIASGSNLERFKREYHVISRVRHPNIVRGLEFISAAGWPPLLVMELLEGHSLKQDLAQTRWSVEQVVELGLALCSALSALSEQGVVRIDLKPHNLIITTGERRPVLVDFGIARLEQAGEQVITQVGAMMGTPSYMSPEQIRAEPTDVRSDIWALGVVLVEALLGRNPIADGGLGMTALLARILRGPFPLDGLPDAPGLRLVLEKALEQAPADRYQTPAEFAEALRSIQRAPSAPPLVPARLL